LVWTSANGTTWTEQYIDVVAADIIWTPTFGVVAAARDWEESHYSGYVALGPNPFPMTDR
jgi:hypothetical protein